MIATVAVLVIVFVVSTRIILENGAERYIGADSERIRIRASEGYDTRTFDFKGITAIDTRGGWTVRIGGGESAFTVTAPENIHEYLTVDARGDTIYLSIDDTARFSGINNLTLTVSGYKIDRIDSAGALSLEIRESSVGELKIVTSGVLEMKASESSIDVLYVNVSGVANIDLAETPIKDAIVELSGMGNAELLMDGGNLTGRLSGAANINYYGSADVVNVETSGASKVRKGTR